MNIVNQENEQKYGEDFPQPIVRNGNWVQSVGVKYNYGVKYEL